MQFLGEVWAVSDKGEWENMNPGWGQGRPRSLDN